MKMEYLITIALRSIRRSPLRSSLTMLGIVIGVAAVVAMVSIGQGATVSIEKTIAKMGNNLLYVIPGSAASGGRHWGAGSVITLTLGDGDAVAAECPSVYAVTPIIRPPRQTLAANERNWVPASFEGVGLDYLLVKNLNIASGRWFGEADIRSAAKVCVIGKTIVEEIFRYRDPVGVTIRVGNTPMEVIGVFERLGSNAWGMDQDDMIVLPWSTVRRHLAGSDTNNVDRLAVSVVSAEAIPRATREIETLLRERHKLGAKKPLDFNIRDLSQWLARSTEMTKTMTSLLAGIASISLLVGGIGIMNIMLVTVSERTREIGLRMSVGARPIDIMFQFLVEAVVLSLVGGLVGIVVGIGIAALLSNLFHWSLILSTGSMGLAMVFSSVIGVAFGFYPAWRASKLDPIECLRYE